MLDAVLDELLFIGNEGLVVAAIVASAPAPGAPLLFDEEFDLCDDDAVIIELANPAPWPSGSSQAT